MSAAELRQAAETLRERAETSLRLADWLEQEANYGEPYADEAALDVARAVNGGAL